mmetsp:Transcript_3765/g.9487  ORF Transcript_3765/g.9487 Transcript_3765/m.9487 type:complete len:247 (+) Transcript_3765:1032-1772(+)
MRGRARNVCQRAHGEVDLWGEEGKDALEARSHTWLDHVHVPSEALCAAVHHRDVCAGLDVAVVVELHEGADQVIHPPACLERVQPHDDDLKLLVELRLLVLDLCEVGRDVRAKHSVVDEFGGDLGLGAPHVRLAEEELPVQVGELDRVHVDDVKVEEAHHGQVLQKLAAQPSSPDDEDAQHVVHHVLGVLPRLEGLARKRPGPVQQLVYIHPSVRVLKLRVHLHRHGPRSTPAPISCSQGFRKAGR